MKQIDGELEPWQDYYCDCGCMATHTYVLAKTHRNEMKQKDGEDHTCDCGQHMTNVMHFFFFKSNGTTILLHSC